MPKRKHIIGLGIASAGLFAAGIAGAAWTADGSGSGQAKAIEAQVVTVGGSGASAQLYPGANGDLKVVVTAPSQYNVKVTGLEPGAVASITSDNVGCAGTTTGLAYNFTTDEFDADLGQVVAAGTTLTYTVADALTMSNSSDATCAGATFGVPVTVRAESAAGLTPGAATASLDAIP